MAKFKCTAAGDAMVFLRLPGKYEGFEELKSYIGQGDFRFLNLETTVHNHETYGAATSGGTWFCSEPGVLEDMKEYGFNILTTANNHATDYGIIGLEKTLDYIHKAGFPVCGTGKTLADAAAPAYLDTLAGRFALLSCTTTFNPDCLAGEQTRSMIGRPGVNGVQVGITYQLEADDLQKLNELADKIGINAGGNILRREGYMPQLKEGESVFGPLNFEQADAPGIRYQVKQADLDRMLAGIREAKYVSDYVVVSIHSHQVYGGEKEIVPPFLTEFAHKCIDAGANAIIGTGPHLLRPMEIYKGCPIFYCLGDSFNQLETIKKAPADMYFKQGLTGNEGMDELFDNRNGHGTRGLYYDRKMFETVVPYWEVEDGKLTKLTLLPVECHFGAPRSHGGFPAPNYNAGIIERFAKMSKAFGTEITIENGLGVVKL